MTGYYTVKLVGGAGLHSPERVRLEIAYVAQLEALIGNGELLLNLCEAARAETEDGAERARLADAGHAAETVVRAHHPRLPADAKFSLSLWAVEDL